MKQETTVYSGVIVYGRPIPKLLSAVLLSHASRGAEAEEGGGGLDGKISYAITYPGASMQSSDLVHPI
jgi:hypothetical protein